MLIINILFFIFYLGLTIYGLIEVVSGIINKHVNTMQPFLAIGLVVAGVVGMIDSIKYIGDYKG